MITEVHRFISVSSHNFDTALLLTEIELHHLVLAYGDGLTGLALQALFVVKWGKMGSATSQRGQLQKTEDALESFIYIFYVHTPMHAQTLPRQEITRGTI